MAAFFLPVRNAPRRVARPALEALEGRTLLSGTPAPLAPVYTATFDDAVTGSNAFQAADGKRGWTVNAGADSYQNDVYERPTAQTYEVKRLADGSERFAAQEYFGNLDIVQAKAGYDANYLYASIKLFGLGKVTSDGAPSKEGLVYRYGLRLAKEADGGHGFLLVADQPGLKNSGTAVGQVGTFGYHDSNGDVGGAGLSVTKQDKPAEVGGNGYETVALSDGKTASGAKVLWVRVNPTDPTVVEFAVDYKALGFTQDDLNNLGQLEFEANKGLQDPANYNWNDEYTKGEAGSPYRAAQGDRRKSEFGTQGLGNVYQLDTVRGGPLLKPSELSGFVYQDADNDGIKDPGEAGLAGVVVTLTGTDDRGAVGATATTDANGFYRFAGLRPGTYALAETQPAGYLDGRDTVGTQGGRTGNDRFDDIVLGAGVVGAHNNFGELPPASLSGFAYHDVDNDGVKDPGEQGLAGVLVTLMGTDDRGNVVQVTAPTDAYGFYRFTNLRPGTYALAETQPAGYLDGQDTVGTQGGRTSNDRFDDIVLKPGVHGLHNNFGELFEEYVGS